MPAELPASGALSPGSGGERWGVFTLWAARRAGDQGLRVMPSADSGLTLDWMPPSSGPGLATYALWASGTCSPPYGEVS